MTPTVGQDIEDICTRCGDTWHVVVAKLGEKVVKVLCKQCNAQHHYRGEKNPVAAGKATGSSWGAARRRRPSKKAAPEPPAAPEFDPAKPPRSYSARDAYFPGERITHPSFGTGVVSSNPGPGKVEVVFPAGARTLASAKEVSTLERPTAASGVPISDRPPTRKV
jgi:hypothetical protein